MCICEWEWAWVCVSIHIANVLRLFPSFFNGLSCFCCWWHTDKNQNISLHNHPERFKCTTFYFQYFELESKHKFHCIAFLRKKLFKLECKTANRKCKYGKEFKLKKINKIIFQVKNFSISFSKIRFNSLIVSFQSSSFQMCQFQNVLDQMAQLIRNKFNLLEYKHTSNIVCYIKLRQN